MTVAVLHDDCMNVLRAFSDNRVDAIVTDPPYGLGFMGKAWDDLPPGLPWAQECLRVIKPGGYLLAFGGARTWHRLAVAVEDAGFELRDSIAWLYGSGFPKSLDVSKAIDKAAGVAREDKFGGAIGRNIGPTGNKKCDTCGKWLVSGSPCRCPRPQDEPVSEDALRFKGWGTALKPAFEPIVVARKPLSGTVAANVLAHGTGALNIDATRVEAAAGDVFGGGAKASQTGNATVEFASGYARGDGFTASTQGRWPTNVVLAHSEGCVPTGLRAVASNGHHPAARGQGGVSTTGHTGQDGLVEWKDGAEVVEAWDCVPGCPVAELDEQSGTLTSGTGAVKRASAKGGERSASIGAENRAEGTPMLCYGDSGGASRFFPTFRYQAKAPTRERPTVLAEDGTKTAHPTVKPLALMRWLVRLVTPPGGVVLDPFAGSGATAEACILEGLDCIAVEREAEYLPLIQVRIQRSQFDGEVAS